MSENTTNNNTNANGNHNHRRRRRSRGRKPIEKKDLSSLRSVSTNTSSLREVSAEKKESAIVNTNTLLKREPSKNNRRRRNRNTKTPENGKKRKEKGELGKSEFKRLFIKNEFGKYKKSKSGSKNSSGKLRKENLPYHTEFLETGICPICKKPITNMTTALLDDTSEQYAHFDCIYDNLKARITIKENERLSYIGNGAFALIEDYKDGQSLKFRIKQQFQITTPSPVK